MSSTPSASPRAWPSASAVPSASWASTDYIDAWAIDMSSDGLYAIAMTSPLGLPPLPPLPTPIYAPEHFSRLVQPPRPARSLPPPRRLPPARSSLLPRPALPSPAIGQEDCVIKIRSVVQRSAQAMLDRERSLADRILCRLASSDRLAVKKGGGFKYCDKD
jgi:hypothetical protein